MRFVISSDEHETARAFILNAMLALLNFHSKISEPHNPLNQWFLTEVCAGQA